MKNANAKLTDGDIRAIRADDRLLTVIGAEYGVSFSVISGIRTRRTWRHVS